MQYETEQVVADFIERMGLIIQADGLPRIAGRIMGLLILEAGPFSFGDLAKRLQVSRASISTNTRLLESLGVIERTGVPGERQDYFRMRPHPYARMLRGYIERMRRAREVVEGTQNSLSTDFEGSRGAHQRLDELDTFYEMLIESFESVVEKWEAREKALPRRQAGKTTGQPV